MWDFRATLSRLHDGDSFWVLGDTMFGQRYEPELRLLDVHAPELTASGDPPPPRPLRLPRFGEPGGLETTAFVRGWLYDAEQVEPPRRWYLYVQTVQTKTYEPTQKQTFTRWLATVWRFDQRDPGASLNAAVTGFLAGHPEWGPGMLPEGT